MSTSPPTNSPRFFYLKSKPISNPSNPPSKYANRYIRYTGSGHADVVLTEAHPVFLKFYLEDGKQLASFKDRVFGFTMGGSITSEGEDGMQGKTDSVRKVEMFENQGDAGFYFDEGDGGKLKWRGRGEGSKSADGGQWEGWVLRENPVDRYEGNPQLFWTTTGSDIELEKGMERVELVAEYL